MSPQKDTQEKPQADPPAESQAEPQSAPTEPNASVPSAGVVWVRISSYQVMRTVVVALLSAAVVLLIYIVVYQQVEGSILQPMVYSHAVQLNALVIFIAVLVGGLLLGIPGALLAIPVVEIIQIVVTEIPAYRRKRQEAN
jgi:hypothetical protein